MPNYSNLSTQVEAIKTEISSSLAASAYSAQDLVYVAKALQALGTVVAPDGVSNITVTDNIYLGLTAESFASTAALTNPNLVIEVDETDYAQIAFRNKNAGASASTDLILYTNNGNDASGYIDMGITSSNFSDPDFTITGKGDGYIFIPNKNIDTTLGLPVSTPPHKISTPPTRVLIRTVTKTITLPPVEDSAKIFLLKKEKGGFLGDKIILDQIKNKPKKIRVGIRPEGKIIAREGTKIFSDDQKEIGYITSGGFGPSVNGPIAMGYIDYNYSQEGTKVILKIRENNVQGIVSKLPFYKKSYVKN